MYKKIVSSAEVVIACFSYISQCDYIPLHDFLVERNRSNFYCSGTTIS